MFSSSVVALALFTACTVVTAESKPALLRLDSTASLEARNGTISSVTYRGRKAVKLSPLAGHENDDGSVFGIVAGGDFQNGVIEADIAGAPHAGADAKMKGFVGIGFRYLTDSSAGELLFLRPVNARLEEQLVRNHSVQYVSDPEYPWYRLRSESPGVYESYADLETGGWTHVKIVVDGVHARLYVNGASQPCLIVNDLKRGDSRGTIVLWAHTTTEAYFSNLVVTSASTASAAPGQKGSAATGRP